MRKSGWFKKKDIYMSSEKKREKNFVRQDHKECACWNRVDSREEAGILDVEADWSVR